MTFQQLLDRVMEAEKPDRVLDRDIHGFVTGKWYGLLKKRSVPKYTQSFEAALTLLPPLVFVEISGGTDTLEPGVWPAVSLRYLPPGQTDPKKWHGTVQGAPTFALAMCRAAIEVRSRLAVAGER